MQCLFFMLPQTLFYITTITHHKYVHSIQTFYPNITNLEDSFISSTFTAITNILNRIITADVNAHLPLSYSTTKNHREELIEDILLNSNHIILNRNTSTCLLLNQTQHPTSPDITTVSADLHDCTSWQTIHSLTSDHLPLLIILAYIKRAK